MRECEVCETHAHSHTHTSTHTCPPYTHPHTYTHTHIHTPTQLLHISPPRPPHDTGSFGSFPVVRVCRYVVVTTMRAFVTACCSGCLFWLTFFVRRTEFVQWKPSFYCTDIAFVFDLDKAMKMVCASTAQLCSEICSENKHFTFWKCTDPMQMNCHVSHALTHSLTHSRTHIHSHTHSRTHSAVNR